MADRELLELGRGLDAVPDVAARTKRRLTDESRTVGAVWVPAWVAEADVTRYVGRAMGGADTSGCCLHEQRRSTGRWVCVFAARHKGKHG